MSKRADLDTMESSEVFPNSPLKKEAERRTKSMRLMILPFAVLTLACAVGVVVINDPNPYSKLSILKFECGAVGLILGLVIVALSWASKSVIKPDYSYARTKLESLAADVYGVSPETFYQMSMELLRDGAAIFLEGQVADLVAFKLELDQQLKAVTFEEIQERADEMFDARWNKLQDLSDRLKEAGILEDANFEPQYQKALETVS